MRTTLRSFVFLLILLAIWKPSPPARADEAATGGTAGISHRLALLLGHTFVPNRRETAGLFVPSWGLDYEVWFAGRFGIGLHADIELETFVIEKESGGRTLEELEREYPIVATVDGLWRAWRGLVLELGPGVELEAKKSLFVVRGGLSYEVEIRDGWDLSPTAFYDVRPGHFDAWTLGLCVGKRFRR